MTAAPTAGALDVDRMLDTAGIVVCCGSGGVGKTTTAAALALRAAERGRKVVVLTIDPARRLAQAMGLTHLDNTPRPVSGIDESAGGSLDAMMLDMKRTFDDVVLAHSDPARAEQILANPFYVALSSSFAGTQEYMAMEKLGQLKALHRWELIVVDTPPTRSALDFLDAPKRLSAFLDGRLVRILLGPARAGGKAYMKVLTVGVSLVSTVLARLVGAQMLTDLSRFVSALETMFGGFRERADHTYRLLKDPATAFVVVAAPERDAMREASYFVERLEQERMPLAGLVVNRVHRTLAPRLGRERSVALAEALEESGKSALTAGVLRLHADRMAMAAREQSIRDRFTAAHPEVRVAEAPALAEDVHDLDGLRAVAACLVGEDAGDAAGLAGGASGLAGERSA